MTRSDRPRRLLRAALTGATLLALAACAKEGYPNSTFHEHTEINAAVDSLFDKLLFWGTLVFIGVEAALLYVILRFRHRPGRAEPKHVHGNTTLEILWTVIPAVILVFIAIPTVRTIFRTQAKAVPNALTVEVIGHQWWWEFRYKDFGVSTANELYLPVGRTVNFELTSVDVAHSFWIPQLSGKRDLVPNHKNFIWFTVDSSFATEGRADNGQCAEYCGASHANMKFRVYSVSPAEFDSWVAGQKAPAAFGAAPAPGQTPMPTAVGAPDAAARAANQQAVAPRTEAGAPTRSPDVATGRIDSVPGAGTGPVGATPTLAQPGAGTPLVQAGYVFPAARLPQHVVPRSYVPASLTFAANLQGDAERGRQLYSRNSCIGCHYINGNPSSVGKVGPNLTHVGTRHTLAAGMFPNDTRHLALWIKNARAMKPGSLMPTLGKGQVDPITKQVVNAGGLDDQQIADIVAYLQALK